MDTVDLNIRDRNLIETLAATNNYNKVKVTFNGMKTLQECEFLGGKVH